MYITSDCLIIETVFFYRMSVQFLKNYDQLLNHHYLNTWNIWKWTRLHDFLQSKRSGVAEVKYAMIASLYGTYTLMIIISSRFMMGWPLVSVINSAHTTGHYTIYRNLSIIVNPVMLRLPIKCLKKNAHTVPSTFSSIWVFFCSRENLDHRLTNVKSAQECSQNASWMLNIHTGIRLLHRP